MVRLRTLGAVDLRDAAGREVRAVLAQPKRLALLAYLAVARPRGFHRRDALLALFWPELDAAHARDAHGGWRGRAAPPCAAATSSRAGFEHGDVWFLR